MGHMKKILIFVAILLLSLSAEELKQWIINVQVPENTPDNADVYIAGNFNSWDPGNFDYKLGRTSEGEYCITLNISTEEVEFKFTLGNWAEVEVDAIGGNIENRVEYLDKPLINKVYQVEDWGAPRQSESVVGDVSIIEDFEIPQLQRTRRIWIYLPPGYHESKKNYPVLYMHDGQNLFSDASSFSGEWGVDETLEKLIANKKLPKMIVVGIDNSEYRLSEYTPFGFDYHGHEVIPEAEQYGKFLIETLKPYIDENYRTKRGRRHTGVAGSSMGGLVSTYLAVKYQDVFSKVGALSSSFGVCRDEMIKYIEHNPKEYPIRFWLDMGSEEAGNMELTENQIPVINALLQAGWKDGKEVKFEVYEGATHNERYWRARFDEVLMYLFK
jgi:predicted alpha/beta superfamily hydrolase